MAAIILALYLAMEFDDNYATAGQDEEAVEIYSKRAIFWFSVLAAPLYGSVLLMLNLKAAGYKRAMNAVMIFTILFFIGTNILVSYGIVFFKVDLLAYKTRLANYKPGDHIVDEKIVLLSAGIIALNVIGALILTRYFFKKYFPDDDYYPKSIINPLIITVLVMFLLRFLGFGGI